MCNLVSVEKLISLKTDDMVTRDLWQSGLIMYSILVSSYGETNRKARKVVTDHVKIIGMNNEKCCVIWEICDNDYVRR